MLLCAHLDQVCVLLRVRQKCNVKSLPLLYPGDLCSVTSGYKTARGHIPDNLSLFGELNSISVCLLNESPCLEAVDGMNVWLWAVRILTKAEGRGLPGRYLRPLVGIERPFSGRPAGMLVTSPRKLSFLASYFEPSFL